MSTLQKEIDAKRRILGRLWVEFPEVWGLCTEWFFAPLDPVPVVRVIDGNVLKTKEVNRRWWVVFEGRLNGDSGVDAVRSLHEVDNVDSSIKTLEVALRDSLRHPWQQVLYAMSRRRQDQYQRITIYRLPRGKTIKDLLKVE